MPRLVSGTYFINAGVAAREQDSEFFLDRVVDAVMFRVLPGKDRIAGLVDFSVEPRLRRRSRVENQEDRDLSRESDWHRGAVGGRWEEIGELQYRFLVAQGLAPEHYLLDVGCGSLRGGVHFVSYLRSGHYFGVDINPVLLEAGRMELERSGLADKTVTLAQSGEFHFETFGRRFDYALAQSVFTHLPLNSIILCLMRLERVLVEGGRFFTTFFENTDGKRQLEPRDHPEVSDFELVTYFDRNPYHYDFATFEWICEGTSLSVERIGEWGHPRGQLMMVFTKS